MNTLDKNLNSALVGNDAEIKFKDLVTSDQPILSKRRILQKIASVRKVASTKKISCMLDSAVGYKIVGR